MPPTLQTTPMKQNHSFVKKQKKAKKETQQHQRKYVLRGLFCLAVQAPLAPQRCHGIYRWHRRQWNRRNLALGVSSLDQDIKFYDSADDVDVDIDVEQRPALVGDGDDFDVQSPSARAHQDAAASWEPDLAPGNVSDIGEKRSFHCGKRFEKKLPSPRPFVRSLASPKPSKPISPACSRSDQARSSLHDRIETSSGMLSICSARDERIRRGEAAERRTHLDRSRHSFSLCVEGKKNFSSR